MCLKIFHTEVVYDMLHWGSTKAVPPREVRVLLLSRMVGREPSPYENISCVNRSNIQGRTWDIIHRDFICGLMGLALFVVIHQQASFSVL